MDSKKVHLIMVFYTTLLVLFSVLFIHDWSFHVTVNSGKILLHIF